MKDFIFIIGASGTGKTTLAKNEGRKSYKNKKVNG